ncbi:hypothetical protein GC176_23260 [bacterium]|nr:hypothetical protein [bacterium]
MIYRRLLTFLVCSCCLLASSLRLEAQPGVRGDSNSNTPLPTQQTFVPASELDVVIAGDAEGVLLERGEFDQLYSAAKKNAEAAPRVPATVVVSSADYAARIDGDHLVIDATVNFEQFIDGWQTLSLPLGGLAVEQARVDGQPARLARTEFVPPMPQQQAANQQAQVPQQAEQMRGRLPEPALLLFHNQPGAATLNLTLSTRLSATGSDLAAMFRLLNVPSATLSVTAPAGKHLRIGGRQLDRPAPIEQPATYVVPVGGAHDLRLLFTDQQGQQSADSLTFAATGYGVSVVPGEIAWQAKTTLQVFGSQLNRLVCLVPRELEITDVSSNGLESWELADSPDDANAIQITLNYRQPFDGQRDVVFRGVMATGVGEPWSLPALVIRNVTSHSGRVVVQHAAGSRMRLVESDGVRPSTGQPGTQVFDVWRENFSLAFETQTRRREVSAVITARLDLDDTQITFGATLALKSRFEPLFDVEFRLPAEWIVEQLQINGQAVNWLVSSREAGWNDYSVRLPQPLEPGQSLNVQFLSRTEIEGWPIETDPVEIPLPNITIAEASTVEGTLIVTARPDLTVTLLDPFALDPAESKAADERLRFFFQQADYAGTVKVSRTPSLISANTVTYARLDRETLWSHLEADLNIDGGGLRELQVGLSESAGEDLQFSAWRRGPQGQLLTPVQIIEQLPGEASGGLRLWTLKLDRRVLGPVSVVVDASTKRSGEDEFAIHNLTIPAAERVNGIIAIEGAPDQQLDVTAVRSDGSVLRSVDPVDVPEPRLYALRERIVAAVRYTSAGHSVGLSETRFDRVAVPTAVCYSSSIESVVGQTGEWQQRAEFQFVAVGAQSLRVRLPTSTDGKAVQPAHLWAALIDGTPIEVRSVGNSYLVPIPLTGQPDARRRLTLLYRTEGGALKASGELEQSPPAVSVIHSSGSEQRLEVLSQSWQLHYPDDVLITASNGAFAPTDDLDTVSLLGDLRSQLSRINRRTLQRNGLVAFFTLLVSGAITVVLKRTGASGRIGFSGCGVAVCAGIVCIFLVALLLPAVQSAREAVHRGGMAKFDVADSAPAVPPAPTDLYFDTSEMEGLATKSGERFTTKGQFEGGGSAAFDEAKPASEPAAATAATPPPVAAGAKVAGIDNAPVRRELEERLRERAADKEKSFWQQLDEVEMAAIVRVPDDQPASDANDWDELTARRRGRSDVQRDKGGLLSLALDLEVPEDSRLLELKYDGTRDAVDGVGLQLRWQDRHAGDLGRAFLMVTVALVLWLMLGASLRMRAIVAVLCITLPLGLVSIAPDALSVVLDGVFLGGLLSVGLWLGRAVLNFLRRVSLKALLTSPIGRTSGTAAGLLLALLVLCEPAVAAEPPATQPGAPAIQPAPPVPPVQKPPRTDVIVPFDPAQNPAFADRVLLTREQFIDLWNLARPDEKFTTPAPRDGILADAFYLCELKSQDDASARVSVAATLILFNFREAAITLPVPLSGIALNSAQLDDKPAALRVTQANGQSVLEVVLPTRGLHTLDLNFDVAAQVSGQTGQCTVPVFPVPSGRVLYNLPEADLAVRVNGSTSAYRRVPQTAEASESIIVPVGSGQPLTIAWRPPQQQGMVDAIVHVDTATTVRLDDRGISEVSRVSISVPQGSVADLSFVVPDGLKIRSLTGPQLSGWESAEVDGQRRLRVFFNPPVSGQTIVDAQLFLAEPVTENEATISLPTIAPLDVTRDAGTIVVSTTDSFSLRAGQTEGLRQIEIGQQPNAPPGTATQQQLAWRYSARPFSLQFVAARRQAESTTRVEHAIVVQRRKVQLGTRVVASLKGAPRSALTFELIDGYLPLSVQATALADWYVTASDGVTPRSLTVEFTDPQLGDVEVIVTGRTTKDPRDLVVEVIPPFPLDMTRRTMWAGVWIDDAYSATASDLVGWEQIDPSRLPGDIRNKQPRPVQYAFQSTGDEAGVISFEVMQAQPRLSADAVVVTTVADTFLDYSLALNWKIDAAATDRLFFLTPPSLENRLKLEGNSIRSVTSEKVGGELRWTIQLNDAIRDRYFALATATLPPATTTVETPIVRFEQPVFDEFGDAVGFVSVDPQRLYSILVNQSQGQLAGQHDSSVEAVLVDDLPIQIGTHLTDQAAEILRVRDITKVPSWTVRRFQQTVGAAASVNVADLTLVVHWDGTWRSQAVYTVRNLRRQFLGVRLPAGSRLLSLFVKDQPSRPVLTELDGQTVHLVPLPKTSNADISFPVKLVFAGKFERELPAGLALRRDELDLPAPQVVTPNESDEYGIPVARTLWNVWLPRDIDALLIDDSKRTNVNVAKSSDTAEAYLKSQLSDLSALLNVTSSSDYSRRSQGVAANNLKQLGLAVHNYSEGLQSEELRQQFEQVQQQIVENQGQIDALAAEGEAAAASTSGSVSDQDRTRVNFNNRALLFGNGPVSTQSLSEDVNLNGLLDPGEDLNGNGVLDNVDVAALGVSSQQSGQSQTPAGERSIDGEVFDYRLSIQTPAKPAAPPETPSDQPASRSDRKSELKRSAVKKQSEEHDSRQLQRQQSVDNLSGLNSLFDQGKGQQPASENEAANRAGAGLGKFGGRGISIDQGELKFGSGGLGGDGSDRAESFGRPLGAGGGMGGMGGGFGGGGGTATGGSGASVLNQVKVAPGELADPQSIAQSKARLGGPVFERIETSPEWTQVGGLSLPVEIPTSGYRLTFSKVSGQPRLGLRVQSRELLDRGIGLVWTVVWLGIAAALIVASRKLGPGHWFSPTLVWTAFAIGLLAWLLLPAPLSGFGFAVFVIAWLIGMTRYARSRQTA